MPRFLSLSQPPVSRVPLAVAIAGAVAHISGLPHARANFKRLVREPGGVALRRERPDPDFALHNVWLAAPYPSRIESTW